MRFPLPSPSISPAARTFAQLTVALALFAVAGGCEDKHIGRLCDIGPTADGGTSIATVTSPALECPSRICLLPSGDTGNPEGTGALCTATCESNDDCSDGETGPMSNLTDKHCVNGFVCIWPTLVGAFKCERMCVCRDFVFEPPGGFQPPPKTICP